MYTGFEKELWSTRQILQKNIRGLISWLACLPLGTISLGFDSGPGTLGGLFAEQTP